MHTMRLSLALSLLLLPLSNTALADPMALFSPENAVDSAQLEEARGGFMIEGLEVTLGNGLVSQEALGELRLIQNGVASALRGEANTSLLGGTIIQNSLNDQMISAQTTLNATVNTAGMLRALNFAEGLNNALSTAIAPR
jgi:hypothetical protein